MNPHKPGGKGSGVLQPQKLKLHFSDYLRGGFLEADWAFVPLIYRGRASPGVQSPADAGDTGSIPSTPTTEPVHRSESSPLATPGASATAVEGSNSSYRSTKVGEKENHVNSLHLPYISRSTNVPFCIRKPVAAPVHLWVKHRHKKQKPLIKR